MFGTLWSWLWGGLGGVGVSAASHVQELTKQLETPRVVTAELEAPATVTVRLGMSRVRTQS